MTFAMHRSVSARSRVRFLMIGFAAAALVFGAGALLRTAQASTDAVQLVGDASAITTGIEVAQLTFDDAQAAIEAAQGSGGPIVIDVAIPGVDIIDLSGATLTIGNNIVAIAGPASVAGLTADVLLTARWVDASTDTVPDLAVAVRVTDVDLAQLNSAWSVVSEALDPHLASGWIVLSSADFSLDPNVLGTSVTDFYGGTDVVDLEAGANLLADIALDHVDTPELRRLARTLGSAASTLRIGGSLADSAGVLFSGSPADLAGLHVRGAVPLPSVLPPWMTSHEPFVDLELVDDGAGGVEPVFTIEDRIETDLGGAINAFAYSATFDPTQYESGAAARVAFTLDQTTLDPPFGMTWLTLSGTAFELSLAAGDDDPTHVEASLAATLAVTPSHLVDIDIEIEVDGTNVSGKVVFDPDPAAGVPVGDLVHLLNQAFPGANFDAGALGADVSLTGIVVEAATTSTISFITGRATATIENDPDDLDADVLVHAVRPAGGDAKLLLGLRAATQSDCNCVRMNGLIQGPVGEIASNLQLPAVDVVTVLPPGASVPDAELSATARGFLDDGPGELATEQPGGVTLNASLRVASLGTAAANAFDWGSEADIILSGHVGEALASTSSGFALPIDGLDLTAVLPAPGPNAAIKPDWMSFTAPLTLEVDYDATAASLRVAVDTAFDATVGGQTFSLDASAVFTRTGDTTSITAVLAMTNSWPSPFGQTWLGTVQNVSLTLTFTMPDAGPITASAVIEGTVDFPDPLPVLTVRLELAFDGTEPEVTLKITAGTVSVADLFTLVGSTLSLPIQVTLDSTVVTVHISPSGALFSIAATTSLAWDGGGVGASFLLVLHVPVDGTARFTAGFRLQGPGGGPLMLSHLLPVPVDFELPNVAFVFSSADLNEQSSELSAPEYEFLKPLYGCALDDDACIFQTEIDGGAFTFLGSIPLPDELAEDGGLLDQLGIPASGAVRLQGTLPLLEGAGDIRLQLFLPAITNDGSLPDLFQRVELSLFLAGSVSPPSIALGVEGELDLRMRQSDTPTSDATACVDDLKGNAILRGADDTGTIGDYCYAVIPMEATAAISISSEGPRIELVLGLSKDDPDYAWQAPFGVEWLTIHAITVQLGVTITPTGPQFDVGALGDIEVGGKRVYGAISLGIATLPNPPFVRPAFRGVIVGSSTGIELNDLYLVYKTIATAAGAPGSGGLPAHVNDLGMPNLALKNLDFRFSLVDDPDLCLKLGLRVQADLYENYVAGDDDETSGACDPPTDVVPCAERNDGCFAGVLFEVGESGIVGQGSIAGFDLGPIRSDNAIFDFALKPTDQHLRIAGGFAIDDLASPPNEVISGHIDLSVKLTEITFIGEANLFGLADAYISARAGFGTPGDFDLTSPQFEATVQMRSTFGNAVKSAITTRLDSITDHLRVMADMWTLMDPLASDSAVRDALADLDVSVASDADVTAQHRLTGVANGLRELGFVDTLWIDTAAAFAGFTGSLIDGLLQAYCLVDVDLNGDGYSDVFGVPCSLDYLLIKGADLVSGTLSTLTDSSVTSDADDFADLVEDIGDFLATNAVPVEVTCAQFSTRVNLLQGSAEVDDLGFAVKVFGSNYGFVLPHWTFDLAEFDENVDAVYALVNDLVFGGATNTSGQCTVPPAAVDGAQDDPADAGLTLSLGSSVVDEGATVALTVGFTEPNVAKTVTIDWGDGTVTGPITGLVIVRTHVYVDDDPTGTKYDKYTITVRNVTDDATASMPITVKNVHPADLAVAVPASVPEGTQLTATATFTDVGADDSHSVRFNWGDGSTPTAKAVASGATSVAATHTYLDNPTSSTAYLGVGLVVDDDGGFDVDPFGAHVTNVAPAVGTVSRSDTVLPENSVLSLSIPFTDPGILDSHTVTVTWGDGATSVLSPRIGARSVTASHRYIDGPNTYPIGITIVDKDGSAGSGSTSISVANVNPVVTSAVLSRSSLLESEWVGLTVAFTDPGTVDTHDVVIDWGDGSLDTTIDVPLGMRIAGASHQYLDDDADDTYTITVTVTDKDDGSGSTSTPVVVRNVAPAIGTLGRSATTIDENGSVALTVPFTDPGTVDTHSVRIAWGDGNIELVALSAAERTLTRSHTYLDDSPTVSSSDVYSITVTVADDDAGSHTKGTSITVNDVAPVVNTGPDLLIDERGTATVNGSFTDVGTLDTHTATIAWGDGSSEPLPLSGKTFSISHQYGDNYASTATVTVCDDDSRCASDTAIVLVRNVAPVIVIDDGPTSGTVLANGVPTFITRAGSSVGIAVDVTDDGSDDETMTWNWGLGTPSVVTSLVDPPSADPQPSPSINPRSIRPSQTNAWSRGCVYDVVVSAQDDDHTRLPSLGQGNGNGYAQDSVPVVVTGTSTDPNTAGFWSIEYTAGKKSKSSMSADQQACYLAIVRHLSTRYSEEKSLATSDQAATILSATGNDPKVMLERQLLAAWLNLANGSILWDQPVDRDGNGIADTTFHALAYDAEEMLRSTTATKAALLATKNVLEKLNMA